MADKDDSRIDISDIKKITINEKKPRWSSDTWSIIGYITSPIGLFLSLAAGHAQRKDQTKAEGAFLASSLVAFVVSTFSILKSFSVRKKEKELETGQQRVDDTLAIVKAATQPDDGTMPGATEQARWQHNLDKEMAVVQQSAPARTL